VGLGSAQTGGSAFLESFPENWEARRQMRVFLFAASSRLSSSIKQVWEQRSGGADVVMRVTSQPNAFLFYFLFADGTGTPRLDERGNVSIKKNKTTDELEHMKVLLRDSTDCYAHIAPEGEVSVVSIVLYGKPIYTRVKLPAAFSRIVTMSMAEITDLTAKRIDWDLVLGEGIYEPYIERLVGGIREWIPFMMDCDDGAYDRAGDPVLIATGEPSPGGMNCSGFAKWVVDGYYYPITGEFMDVERLKTKQLNTRGTRWSRRYEDERDPYFGLDWSRNLAAALEEARSKGRDFPLEGFDVRRVPFFAYREDIGYPTADLRLILYMLARKSPRRFYLGSVNQPYGEDLSMRQHTHLVVLVPHFTREGGFRVAVFERGAETSLDSLIDRFADDYIHLVAVESGSRFQPLVLSKEEQR
jgi:hypothetical protein